MVSITKWVLLGAALIGFGLFTKEATATSLTGTLARTGLAGSHIGGALSSVGSGTGDLFRGLLTPLWEVGNFVKSWTNGSATTERENLTGQGGGFTDAETQGGGDTGINTEPVIPNWFNFNPLPEAAGQQSTGMYAVGGTDIKMTEVHGQVLPLSSEARDWYSSIGVQTGGGSNASTGAGGGEGASISSGNFGGTDTSHGWGF